MESWCKPCIAAIPDLVELAENNKNNLQVVSVAFDKITKLDLVRKIIAEKK